MEQDVGLGMILNVALGLVLMLCLCAFIVSHQRGWLADFVLRLPSGQSRSTNYALDRSSEPVLDRPAAVELQTESTAS